MPLLLALAATCTAASGAVETRTYRIDVDGKPSGHHRMIICQNARGQTTLTSDAEVHVHKWIIHYSYKYHGIETWQGGYLRHLEAQSTENNSRSTVSLAESEKALVVNVDGKAGELPRDVWTDTYWQLPPRLRDRNRLTLVECDSGERFNCTLKALGQEIQDVCGHKQLCQHYRLGGDRQSDIWFDDNGKLVKESHVDDGHLAVIQLQATELAQK